MSETAAPIVILLFGDDELAMDERLADFVGRLAEPATVGLNLSRFSVSGLDMGSYPPSLVP